MFWNRKTQQCQLRENLYGVSGRGKSSTWPNQGNREQSIGSLGLDYYGYIVLVAVIAMQDGANAHNTLVNVLQNNWGNKAQQKSLKPSSEEENWGKVCEAEMRSRIRRHSKMKQ